MSITTTQINVGGSAIIGGDLKIGLHLTYDAENPILVKGNGNIVTSDISLKSELRNTIEILFQNKIFQELKHANNELALSYEATLEGWLRALNIRDKETEDHTERVTELAIRIARTMGMSGEEIIDIRRGALLYSLGKMNIVNNLEPLYNYEWFVFHKYPEYIRNIILAPIFVSGLVLDIPCSYNERWDGKGFPRGLKGKEIPLAARIFAVADVWDSLYFEHPYRKAVSNKTILKRILKQAGKRFDPDVVETLQKVTEGNE